jgi:hypothetical protein
MRQSTTGPFLVGSQSSRSKLRAQEGSNRQSDAVGSSGG